MSVNYEIKSQLAKLLATEDLLVEHKKVETASFNVDTRVLTLPTWDTASNDVYDLLVAHEVGHALFTPNIDWTDRVNVPPMFVNIVEDARIEKLMKRKYGGLSKTFYRGYKELNDKDFFSIEEHGVDKYGLADKVNLYFKIGNFVDISFDSIEETHIVSLINNAETFDEVLIASEELYKFCKQKKEQQSKIKNLDEHKENGSASGETENTEQDTEQDTEQVSDQMDADDSVDSSDDYESTEDDSDELTVDTMDSLDKNLRKLNKLSGEETDYIEIPDIDLETFVVDNETIHDQISEYFNTIESGATVPIFDNPDSEFNKFKKSAQKEVNYLVKEFECKKSADAYARAFTSRTGVLDTSKLHTYKYNEDLFKKVNIIPDGKNHGLIFIIDWSGSMGNYILDTIKQLYNLVWFCQKVKIPFDVYAFTNSYKCLEFIDHVPVELPEHHEMEEGKFYIPKDTCVVNLFTSGKKNSVLEKQMLNIWRNVYAMRYYCNYSYFYRLGLGGTPLNEALVALHKILPKFKNQHKLQKVQCVVLTDGEGCHLSTMKEKTDYYSGDKLIRPWRMSTNSFMRNRKTGHTYKISENFISFTNMILEDLRQTFQDTNFIGIRILTGTDFSRMNSSYNGYGDAAEKARKDWKKEKCTVVYNCGYNAYFMLQSNALQNDSEFEVSEDATKTQIKNAFKKSLMSKKMNKKILNEFVELVA